MISASDIFKIGNWSLQFAYRGPINAEKVLSIGWKVAAY